MDSKKWLDAKAAAEHLNFSPRQLHERTAARAIPLRQPANTRKMLFLREELDAYVNGAELETVETPNGGLIVRPVAGGAV
jgi:hypothetical protein